MQPTTAEENTLRHYGSLFMCYQWVSLLVNHLLISIKYSVVYVFGRLAEHVIYHVHTHVEACNVFCV